MKRAPGSHDSRPVDRDRTGGDRPDGDLLGRPLRSLRISVTDRCNLRCRYCMPAESYSWLPQTDLLRFEEVRDLVAAFCDTGVNRVRLTGGEPLLRRDLPELVRMLAAESRLADLALTTNGVLLAGLAQPLADAGLKRLTISLDSLQRSRFEQLAQRDELRRVLDGIEAVRSAGFENSKLDAVVVRGRNDDELIDLLEFGRRVGFEVRFIEYMDVGGARGWNRADVVSKREILTHLREHYGDVQPCGEQGSSPARRYRLPDGTAFGIIASTTDPFCGACDRSRLTSDGMWYRCLYARAGDDLRTPLRAGASCSELAQLIGRTWSARGDRGAEDRLREEDRGALFAAAELGADPHLEMHTRGG